MVFQSAFPMRPGCQALVLALILAGSPPAWPAPTVTTLAGVPPAAGTTPVFVAPLALVVDGSGNLFVSDSGNHAIRRVTPEGVVSTYAGVPGQRGSQDGPAATARFNGPVGLALDGSGNLYVADAGNSTIRKITPGGQVSTLAGAAGVPGDAEGQGSAARFFWPAALAVDASGTLFVVDTCNNCIRKIDAQGVVTTFLGVPHTFGSTEGPAKTARIAKACGMAIDPSGNLYLGDTLNHRICRITPDGTLSTLAGSGVRGSADGVGKNATFWGPFGVAVDASGNVFVADVLNQEIRRITSNGTVSSYAGTVRKPGHADGPAAGSSFSNPSGVAVDAAGNLYVADTLNGTIRKITP